MNLGMRMLADMNSRPTDYRFLDLLCNASCFTLSGLPFKIECRPT